MKNTLLGLALVTGTLAFSQKISNTPIKFGLKGGLNLSTLSDSDMKAKAGFYGGAFANIPVAEIFSVQPEVLYNGLGAKSKSNSDVKFNLDYMAVPVMFQYNAIQNLYLEAGPQFSFLLSSKVKDSSTNLDVKELTKAFDFGLGFGAGYYFTPNIGINVRYVAGLSDIVKNRANGSDSVKNSGFQIGLAYKL